MEKLAATDPLNVPEYKAPLYMPGGHLQTIVPSFRRFKTKTDFSRERIYTDDDDFLDIDWLKNGHKKLVILSHGLEGSSRRPYIVGMARRLCREYDILAWNFRSCGGEINRRLRFYHSGATDDLQRVIRHAKENGYDDIRLLGFSMGGNITVLYLAGQSDVAIKGAVAFSVPCDLAGSASNLARASNRIYMSRFMKMLRAKIYLKKKNFPELDVSDISKMKTFFDFDDAYTAPIHGFKNAEDYWAKCSSAAVIERIKRPLWIVNAANDPFLSEGCYPIKQTDNNPNVQLVIPKRGGHVGFARRGGTYWSEEFAAKVLATI